MDRDARGDASSLSGVSNRSREERYRVNKGKGGSKPTWREGRRSKWNTNGLFNRVFVANVTLIQLSLHLSSIWAHFRHQLELAC